MPNQIAICQKKNWYVEAVLEVGAGAMRDGGVALASKARSVEQHLGDGAAAGQRGVGRAAV